MKYNDNRNIIVRCRNRRKHTHTDRFFLFTCGYLVLFRLCFFLRGYGKMGNLVFKPHPFSNNQGYVVYGSIEIHWNIRIDTMLVK